VWGDIVVYILTVCLHNQLPREMERTNMTYHVLLLDAVIRAFLIWNYITLHYKLPYLPLLKSPLEAHVRKTTYAPMLYTSLYVMFLMRADPLLGQVGGGWTLEISTFLGPKWHTPNGSMPFRAQKSLNFQGSKL
jgi:hypothetical protein